MRCAMRGTPEPEDEEHLVCPVTIRRTIAGTIEVGICGLPLED
jgi:hypothetical protein